MSILLLIIVLVLFVLLGALVYRRYVKSIAKVDISIAFSRRILLLGFAGCALFGVIFGLLSIAYGHNCEPVLFCLIAFIFGPIGVQSFIYSFMTKSVDGVQIRRLHAIILSIIFYLPGLISIFVGISAMEALIGNF